MKKLLSICLLGIFISLNTRDVGVLARDAALAAMTQHSL